MCDFCASHSTCSPRTLIRHLPAADHLHLAAILQVGLGLSLEGKLLQTRWLPSAVVTALTTTITAAARLPFSTCVVATVE